MISTSRGLESGSYPEEEGKEGREESDAKVGPCLLRGRWALRLLGKTSRCGADGERCWGALYMKEARR